MNGVRILLEVPYKFINTEALMRRKGDKQWAIMKDGITYGATMVKYWVGYVQGVNNLYQCIRSIFAGPSSRISQYKCQKRGKKARLKSPIRMSC